MVLPPFSLTKSLTVSLIVLANSNDTELAGSASSSDDSSDDLSIERRITLPPSYETPTSNVKSNSYDGITRVSKDLNNEQDSSSREV
jgi:hypothetical protein